MKKYYSYAAAALTLLLICWGTGCKQKKTADTEETEVKTTTPVIISSVSYDPLEESVELNATSTFLQKSFVKSNLNGYVKSVTIQYASSVRAGQPMFTLQTKEADAIGNTINKLDPGFKFSGINIIRAGKSGYVSELNHQAGDYVQDGEQLAVISDVNSFVFIMNVPYEYRQYVAGNKQVEITLPDGERMLGNIQSAMPFMDSVSQTQAVAIKAHTSHPIPQNLVAKVKVIKTAKAAATSLPKAAVLSDETQTDFWIMKLINDSTAVKVPVKKGIETAERVEILFPVLNPADKIIIKGNYGLPDTAKVSIENK